MEPIDLSAFTKSSKSDWHKLATTQLKGNDPDQQLKWESEGLTLYPYYDQSDLHGLNYISNFFKDVSFRWKLYEKVDVRDESEANETALEALKGGCDGIIFSLEKKPTLDLLLRGIMTDICDISIVSKQDLSSDELPTNLSGFQQHPSSTTTYFLSEESEQPQLSFITKCIKELGSKKHIVRYASSDFFLEIASIRALRFLIDDMLNIDPFGVTIHTLIPPHADVEHQWFLNSTAGLSSILGGTNTICFTTTVGNTRISRNVGNLIREESGIERYSDQCNGAYFIENLTHQIIEACKSRLN